MIRWPSVLTLALLTSLGAARGAAAATISGALPVSARITPTCDIGGSATGALASSTVDFGTPTFAKSTTVAITGTLPIHCNAPATVEVTLDNGQNATGTQRNLRGPGGTLIAYDLLRGQGSDAPLWDNGRHPVTLPDDTAQDVAIAGRLTFPSNTVADGLYTDTVLVRIDY
jgi:spore coat protein U-like protein